MVLPTSSPPRLRLRYVNAGVELFAERHQPLVRRILGQAAGAVSGYVSGNLAISVICGVVTFVVLLILGMPYAAPLALLVAVLDLVPLVGATLCGALVAIPVAEIIRILVTEILAYRRSRQEGSGPAAQSSAPPTKSK